MKQSGMALARRAGGFRRAAVLRAGNPAAAPMTGVVLPVSSYPSSRAMTGDAADADGKDRRASGGDANADAAAEYNATRAAYKKTVGKLRRRYREDHIEAEKTDRAARDAAAAATTRRRLERQRAKNERTFRNALRQEELRRQAEAAFEDHLRVAQAKREADRSLHRRARQLLLDELEEESHLWLTTSEEVDAAFDDPSVEQSLWARPQGVLGVPEPSLDSHFWSHEGHTWDRSKTYKTRSELLLEDLEREAYESANVDPSVWTESAVTEAEAVEAKARLRANVRLAGRRALLQRQKDYLAEESSSSSSKDPGEAPSPPPVPSLGVLGNVRAQEKEGARLLLEDPSRFFVFEGSGSGGGGGGRPVGLRDPLRTGKPQGRVFPVPVGKLPKPDLRSEKERKRQEREERLWAAASGGASAAGASEEDMLLAEEDREIGEAIDYEEAHAGWDSDDEEWEKGLDEDLDRNLLRVPRENRYRDEDLDAVAADLEAKAAAVRSHVTNTVRNMEREALSRLVEPTESDVADGDEKEASTSETAAEEEAFFDADTASKLEAVGADVAKYESLMASLTDRQLLALFGLEARWDAAASAASDRDDDSEGDGDETASTEEEASVAASTKVLATVEGLTESQIDGLAELESFLRVAEHDERP
mmetsp:Transcript_12177/g.28917  ORF Transcript_12177/g.28917 Transcript_12177/m.28917 type:complete len:650 (-) Transcript_12177:191-2140(-)